MRLPQRPVLWIGLTTVVRAVGILVMQKYIAYLGGPAWVALLAHFQNLAALVTALPSDGIGRSMKVQAGGEIGPKQRWAVYGQALSFYALAAMLIALFGFAFPWFTPALFSDVSLWQCLLASTAMGTYVFFLWIGGVQQNQGRYVYYFTYQALSVLAGLLVLWLAPKVQLTLLLSLWLLAQGVVILPFIIGSAKKLFTLYKRQLIAPEVAFLQRTGGFLLLGAGIALSGKAGDFFVREYAFTRFSPVETGLWQAGVRLADIAYIPVQAYLAGVFFPHLARLQNHPLGLAQAARKQVLRLALGGVPAYVLFALAAPALLGFFYTPDFVAGYDLLLWHLPGELLRVLALVPAYTLVARSQTRLTLGLELFSLFVYLFLLPLLLPAFGLAGLPMAHSLRYVFYTAAIFWFAGRPLAKKLGRV